MGRKFCVVIKLGGKTDAYYSSSEFSFIFFNFLTYRLVKKYTYLFLAKQTRVPI